MLTDGKTLILDVDKIGEIKESKNGKEYKTVTFRIKSTSEILNEAVFMNTFKYDMKDVGEGDTVEAFINPAGFLAYRRIDTTSTVPQATETSSQQVKTEREVTGKINQTQKAIMYQAFAKSYIESGNNDTDAIDTFAQIMCDKCITYSQE